MNCLLPFFVRETKPQLGFLPRNRGASRSGTTREPRLRHARQQFGYTSSKASKSGILLGLLVSYIPLDNPRSRDTKKRRTPLIKQKGLVTDSLCRPTQQRADTRSDCVRTAP